MKTWERVKHNDIPPGPDKKDLSVLKGTWEFKLKRLPDGSTLKYKACYYVPGDLQIAGVEYFETYNPVVQWSTVHLALTMIFSINWHTKQVDYTNAFYQEDVKKQVYIYPSCGFGGSNSI